MCHSYGKRWCAPGPAEHRLLTELMRQSDSLRGALAIKGQMLGPISVAAQLTDERQQPLIYDDMFFDALAQHLRLRAVARGKKEAAGESSPETKAS